MLEDEEKTLKKGKKNKKTRVNSVNPS